MASEPAIPERPSDAAASLAAAPSPGELLAPRPGVAGPLAPARPAPPEEPLRLPSAARAEPDEHARYRASRHFGALDGLRALAILAVLWHHTVGGPGRLGANLFFLLSGFLVTTILLREAQRTGTVAVARFRARRARRLYPLYFAALAGYVVLVAWLEPPGPTRSTFFENLPAFATFTSNLLVGLEGERVIFYFAWSLAAQEQFYLVWPLFLKHCDARTSARAAASLLLTAYLTRAGLFDLALPAGSFLRTVVLSLLPAILLGALLALALDSRPSHATLRRALGGRWTALILLALVLAIWRNPWVPEVGMHLALAALVAACVVREDHVLAGALRFSPLVHVGTVSYGIYLLHMLCHNAVERGLTRLDAHRPVLDFALTAALAVLVATLSQRHFERLFLPADKRRRSEARAAQ